MAATVNLGSFASKSVARGAQLGGSAASRLRPSNSLIGVPLLSWWLGPAKCNEWWLYPAFALHGVMLGGTIVGAEPTPLLAYFIGLFVAQAAMLLLVRRFSDPVVRLIGDQGMRLAAGIWIGIGCAFSWSMMVA